MATFAEVATAGTLRFDDALKSALQASWNELMPDGARGAIQVEYGIANDGTLQYVKIWESTKRGYWNLVCEQWTTDAWSHVPGLQFSNGYYSEFLARFLELVARHQDILINVPGGTGNGSLQISPPTDREIREARSLTTDVVAVLSASHVEQLVRAWTEKQTGEMADD